jgi:hypothetical protein
MKVILKEGEFDKLPRPKDFGYKNILEYRGIDKYFEFTVFKRYAENIVVEYNGLLIEFYAERFTTIQEVRDNKLNELI